LGKDGGEVQAKNYARGMESDIISWAKRAESRKQKAEAGPWSLMDFGPVSISLGQS